VSILWSPTGPQLRPVRGLFWRAVSWSRMASSLQQVTTRLNMFSAQLVAIADVNQKVTVAMPSGQTQTGAIASLLKQAVVSMVVAQIQQGTITVTEGKIVTALAMNVMQGGTIATSLPKVLSATNVVMLPSGSIADQLPIPAVSMVGGQTQPGIIADVMPLAVTNLVGGQTDQGTIASTLYQVATAALGAQGLGVSIADVLPGMSTVVNGYEVPGGPIADILPPVSTAMVGAQTQYGTIVDIIPQPTTAVQGAQTGTGTIASTLGMPSSAIVANQTQGGTVTDRLLQISTVLNAIEHPQLAVAVALQLASTAITAGQAQSGVVADVLLKAVTSLQSLQTQSGTIASSVIQALTAIAMTYVSAGNAIFKSSATAEATTIATMPTHASGDVLYMFAFRDGTAVAPTVPAGWTQIGSAAANSCAAILAYKIAASSSETSGTWTNASELVCQVYSGAYGKDFTFAFQTGSSATVTYPALPLINTSGSSLVAAFGGHRSINGSMGTAPTGMTQRANREGATADAAGFDTNGGVTSWSSQNVASGETASGYITCVVEVLSLSTAGIVLDSAQSTAVAAASATLATAVSAGAYVFIDITCDSNVNISSVTFGGTTITANDTALINASASNGKVWRYYVPSATAANQSAVVTMSASTNLVVGVTSYLGAGSRSAAQTVTGNQLRRCSIWHSNDDR
jgi:hypothetical protein